MTTAAVWLGSWLRGTADPTTCSRPWPSWLRTHLRWAASRGRRPRRLPDLLRAIRVTGAQDTWLLLPRPGRTIGWPPGADGVPEPAVLLSRGDQAVGMLRHGATGWRWDDVGSVPLAALQSGVLTARSGARALAEAVTAAAERLETLGLDRVATRAAPHAWEVALGRLPRGLDPQVEALLVRLAALHDALDLAPVEEGAAVTAAEAQGAGGRGAGRPGSGGGRDRRRGGRAQRPLPRCPGARLGRPHGGRPLRLTGRLPGGRGGTGARR